MKKGASGFEFGMGRWDLHKNEKWFIIKILIY